VQQILSLLHAPFSTTIMVLPSMMPYFFVPLLEGWCVGGDVCIGDNVLADTTGETLCLRSRGIKDDGIPLGTAFYNYGEYNSNNCSNNALIAKPQCLAPHLNCSTCLV
jgi:hypothetical protein